MERAGECFFSATPFVKEVTDLFFALFLGDRFLPCSAGEGGLSEAEVGDQEEFVVLVGDQMEKFLHKDKFKFKVPCFPGMGLKVVAVEALLR